MKLKMLAICTALIAPAVAHAEWKRAESKNFIVFSEGSEEELRKATENMEKFAFVQAVVQGKKDVPPSPVKLKVYMVPSVPAVVATMPFPAYGVGGYYNPVLRGPFLVTPRRGLRGTRMSSAYKVGAVDDSFSADGVFYHELTHHFMFQYSPAAYPSWYSEGFAEFWGGFQIDTSDKGDVVRFGLPQTSRLSQINSSGSWLPAEKLLTARSYADAGDAIGLLYAEGWLLTHYSFINSERNKQLQTYLAAINRGESYADAAKEGFGTTLNALDSELKDYARSTKLGTQQISFKPIPTGDITIRATTPAENELLDEDQRLSGGIAKSDIDAFVRRVREGAAKFPNDPYALGVLTETEDLAGNAAEADAALKRWIAVAPRDAMALMFKGKLATERLKAAKSTSEAAWDAARQDILAAIKLAPNVPRVYKVYYDSWVDAGRYPPPPGALNGLAYALKLVPNDDDLRYLVAKDYETRDMIPEAIAVIRPLAYTIKPDSELSPREKRNRDKAKKEYALVGEDVDRETPRDMYDRLLKKQAEAKQAKPGAK
ncbi:hypothetical protein [Sphingomonas sp.]|uniref:hypothetical protein n=1 Tax=Sphingomonas sp. TaxID=28214 RepID=UPI001EB8441F|nr:hypothetical protein [Sphingomonas sp.]MBX3594823.1 hypothetical protein [Sphingomonas sp.]